MYIIYAYGTLRPGKGDTLKVAGQLYDLGWFPGIKLGGLGEVVCEKIEIKDLSAIDAYEGYIPSDPENSLYIRRPFLDGYIYEYNREVDPLSRIKSGDWLYYKQGEP